MPLFEFRCRECEHDFELLVRNREAAVCPHCGSEAPDKLISAAAVSVARGTPLSLASACPPPEAGPCSPTCCRLPMG